ncbi:hypothetical protein CEQ90_19685 [Lewinellaceae bacterium SD302]|nr:hypothetical protein CEQ90_19685 [Lewinellaceae bacterium SD302]
MLRKIVGTIILVGILLGQLFTLQRCANPLPPKGGPKDTIGPQLVPEETTPGFQTNFRPSEIELTFNEWVQLKDPTQVLVSPPVEPAPKITLRKKTLTISFGDAVLRDSATYVVNIGGAVVDLTESNPPDNLRFVFATGPVLDSASVSGRLVNAYDGEPLESGLFALYANLADTAARTENPFYFARSDENGLFNISNIKPGTYRGIALDNSNQSTYKLDERATKAYGFPDTLIVIPDGAIRLPDVRVSEVPLPLRLLTKDTSNHGQIDLVFDRPANQVFLQSENDYLRIDQVDTMRLFYTENQGDSLFFSLDKEGENPVDTLVLQPRTEARATFSGRPRVTKLPASSVNPLQQPALLINRPIAKINDSLLRLRKDTFPDLLKVSTSVDSQKINRLLIEGNFGEDQRYQLDILPGAIEDVFGKVNADTIKATFRITPLSSLGTLNLQLRNFDAARAYLLKLIKGNEKTPVDTLIVQGKENYDRVLPGLAPGGYKLEIVRDDNRNQRFDGGNYDLGLQPETVRTFTLENLRADWEVEAIIDLNQLPARAPAADKERPGPGKKGRGRPKK